MLAPGGAVGVLGPWAWACRPRPQLTPRRLRRRRRLPPPPQLLWVTEGLQPWLPWRVAAAPSSTRPPLDALGPVRLPSKSKAGGVGRGMGGEAAGGVCGESRPEEHHPLSSPHLLTSTPRAPRLVPARPSVLRARGMAAWIADPDQHCTDPAPTPPQPQHRRVTSNHGEGGHQEGPQEARPRGTPARPRHGPQGRHGPVRLAGWRLGRFGIVCVCVAG